MESQALFEVVQFALSLLAIWYAVFYLYKDYRIDSFRQKVFELRDRMFDDAAGGMIDFNHPAYCMLRRTMNGFARFSHKLSLLDVLALAFSVRVIDEEMKQKYSFNVQWENATKNLEGDVHKQLDRYRMEMNSLLLSHVVKSSPLLLVFVLFPMIVLVVPIVVFFILRQRISNYVQNIMSGPMNEVEATALALGQL